MALAAIDLHSGRIYARQQHRALGHTRGASQSSVAWATGSASQSSAYPNAVARSQPARTQVVPSASHAVALCVLAERIDGLPIASMAVPCQTLHVGPGTPAVIAGFGLPEVGGEFGTKRYAFTWIAEEADPDGTIRVGDPEVSGCSGDSGGPAYIQLEDGTWWVLGVLSSGPGCEGGPGVYALAHPHLVWFEATSQVDLTPCHHPDGTPDLEARSCQGFPLDPLDAEAAWATLCTSARSDLVRSCEEDLEPPVLEEATATCACSARPPPGPSWLGLVTLLAVGPARRGPRRPTRLPAEVGSPAGRTSPSRGRASAVVALLAEG